MFGVYINNELPVVETAWIRVIYLLCNWKKCER
jgi:hypothetical protein